MSLSDYEPVRLTQKWGHARKFVSIRVSDELERRPPHYKELSVVLLKRLFARHADIPNASKAIAALDDQLESKVIFHKERGREVLRCSLTRGQRKEVRQLGFDVRHARQKTLSPE